VREGGDVGWKCGEWKDKMYKKNNLRKEGSGEVGKNKKRKCLNSQRKKDAEKHQKNIDIRSSCTTLKP